MMLAVAKFVEFYFCCCRLQKLSLLNLLPQLAEKPIQLAAVLPNNHRLKAPIACDSS